MKHLGLVMVAVSTSIISSDTCSAQALDFVYDTTLGTTTSYTGDLSQGTLSINHIAGRNFRVQELGGGVVVVENGVYEGTALGGSLFASMNLVSFNDSGSYDGSGDTAIFSGNHVGNDFVVVDEFGHYMSGDIDLFELTDRTNSQVRPGIEGQGTISNIIFSSSTFQGLLVDGIQTFGNVFTFTFVVEQTPGNPVSLEEYLASGGLGGLQIEIETLEVDIPGGAPLPATSALAISGLLPFTFFTGRRRKN